MHDCGILFKNDQNEYEPRDCHDINQGGAPDWHFEFPGGDDEIEDEEGPNEKILTKWELRRNKKTGGINYDCPARRILNTLDYKDVKVGIGIKNLYVYGFYTLTKPGKKLILAKFDKSSKKFSAGPTN